MELHGSTKEMLEGIERSLPQIRSVINLADRRLIFDPNLAAWLQHLKDAVYEADDVLEDLEARQSRGKSTVSGVVSSVKNLVFSDKDAKKLKMILKKLYEIAKGVGHFIQLLTLETDDAMHNMVVRAETSSLPFEDEILIGRDNERDAILDMLLFKSYEKPSHVNIGASSSSSDLGLRVLPLVGVGGVGKSALARLIYNHLDTTREDDKNKVGDVNQFDVKSWVYVSDNQDRTMLTMQIMHNLVACFDPFGTISFEIERMQSSISNSSLNAVQLKLRDFLSTTRFFIVLDDVWDEMGTVWNGLRSPLNYGAEGSVILVTTQCQLTAKLMGTIGPTVLAVLEENDYQELFEHCAFGDANINTPYIEELQPIGRQIASKLHGLPLAAKAVGSLLKSNLDVNHWKRVLQSEWWELKENNYYCLNKILPSLGLCFQHLGANLKQCFAYCSLFPKGYIFEKDRLVQMWVAQGYIQIEDPWFVFDELMRRSFFQPIGNNRFVMHDVMRELAVYVSSKECFVLEGESKEIPHGTRHLSLKTDRLDALIDDMKRLKRLRTILFFGDYDSENFVKFLRCLFKQSRSLRVLDLSYSRVGIKCLPNDINSLSHLRYLDLSYTQFEYLPETVGELFRLNVLNLRGCHFRSLPKDINNLIKLRHLYADGDTLSLVNGIGKLTCLQELIEFRVNSDPGHHVDELKHMNELQGQLKISNLEKVGSKEDAMNAMLVNKGQLYSLELSWTSGERREENLLEGLQPHHNLKVLVIRNYCGVTHPSTWMMTCQSRLSNLQSIHLLHCKTWNILPPLGQLQCLKVLYIFDLQSIRRVDDQLYGNNDVTFPSLEELAFCYMNAFEEWLAVGQGRRMFPRLRKLHICHCIILKKSPLLSLKPSLVELRIRDCGNLGRALPDCLQNLSSLTTLEISQYRHNTSINLHNLSALRHLVLSNADVEFVDGLYTLDSLKMLEIFQCPKLRLAPYPESFLPSLTHLEMDDTFRIDRGWAMNGGLGKLKYLKIHGQMVEWIQHLTSLKDLHLFVVTGNLPQMLPPSLQKLVFNFCPSIHSLPEDCLPTSLKELHIFDCPQLVDFCLDEIENDGSRISCIPYIHIDGETIQML